MFSVIHLLLFYLLLSFFFFCTSQIQWCRCCVSPHWRHSRLCLCSISNLYICQLFINSLTFCFLPYIFNSSNSMTSMWYSLEAFQSLFLFLYLQSCCLSLIHYFFGFFFLSLFFFSPLRLSDVSVVFTFSISLNDCVPSSPIPLPVNHSSFLWLF